MLPGDFDLNVMHKCSGITPSVTRRLEHDKIQKLSKKIILFNRKSCVADHGIATVTRTVTQLRDNAAGVFKPAVGNSKLYLDRIEEIGRSVRKERKN